MPITANTLQRMLTAPVGLDRIKYGADHLHDVKNKILLVLAALTGVGLIVGIPLYLYAKQNQIKIKEHELQQLTLELTEAFLAQSLSKNTDMSVSIKIKTKDGDKTVTTTVTFSDTGQGLNVSLKTDGGDETFALIDRMTVSTLKESLDPEKYILEKLMPIANKFVEKNTVGLISCEYGVKEVTVPEQPVFVKIHAGSTFSAISTKERIADNATTVMTNGAFAVTVVDGCDFDADPDDSRQYSAAITAAALHTVQHGILGKKFESAEQRQQYFFNLTQIIAKNWSLQKPTSAVTFSGAVVYFDPTARDYQLFAYGLGDTALAFEGGELADQTGATLHLQGNFAPSSSMAASTGETLLPALGKQYTRVLASHMTAKVVDIPAAARSLQLMTDGGESYFHMENNGSTTTPTTGTCIGLPEHGQLLRTEKNILNTVNPQNYQAAVRLVEVAQELYTKQSHTLLMTTLIRKLGRLKTLANNLDLRSKIDKNILEHIQTDIQKQIVQANKLFDLATSEESLRSKRESWSERLEKNLAGTIQLLTLLESAERSKSEQNEVLLTLLSEELIASKNEQADFKKTDNALAEPWVNALEARDKTNGDDFLHVSVDLVSAFHQLSL